MLGVSRFRVQATLLMVGPHGTTKFATEKESRFMNHYGNGADRHEMYQK